MRYFYYYSKLHIKFNNTFYAADIMCIYVSVDINLGKGLSNSTFYLYFSYSFLDATLKARIKRFIIEQRIKLEDLNAIHQRYDLNDYCFDNDCYYWFL